MKRKTKKILILISPIIILGICGVFLAQKMYFAPTDEINIPLEVSEKFTKRVPTTETRIESVSTFNRHLIIPSLSIDAKIQDVGITRKGNMSTPSNFFDVGLYKYGPLPGDKGNAVIDGHVDNGLGLKAVFGNLKNIKVGDDIYVEREKDIKVHFVVSSIDTYDYNAPSRVVFEGGDESYVKLITCAGTWIPNLRTHDKRLVVTAIKLEN